MNSSGGEIVSALEPATTPSHPPTSQHSPVEFPLPEEPLVTIEPSKSWVALNLRDLWTYRELLYFLIWRDLKVRYKQTIIGAIWVIVQPLSMTLIFTLFLGWAVQVPSDGLPYPIFVFAGLLPWTFFSGALASSGTSMVGSSHLITKIYFPRMIIPIAAVGGRLVDFGVAFVVLAGMMIYYRVPVTSTLLLLPLFVALITLLVLGIGMWTSALNVKYRDAGLVLPVLIQLWMFASPIVYPLSLVPARWQKIYALNPLVGIITGFRAALLGQKFQWMAVAISTVITLVMLVFAAYFFRRVEKRFADLV